MDRTSTYTGPFSAQAIRCDKEDVLRRGSFVHRRRRRRRARALSFGLAFGGLFVAAERSDANPRPLASRFASVNHPLRIVAHRGGAAFAPENTLAAYEAAIARGDEAAECDVRVTRDGQLVVLHDARLQRTTNGHGRVERRRLDQVRRLDASNRWRAHGFDKQTPPRLSEVLDLTRDQMVLFVELKRGRGIVEKLAAELERRPDQRAQIVIISFDARLIRRASELMPDVPRMLLRRPRAVWSPHVVAYARKHGATMLGLDARAARTKIVRRAHAEGLPVYAFTVNDTDQARKLVSMGVDGLITDAPPRLSAMVGD